MKKAHRAFTLVELLIVIIIIGTLAGMMMLAAGSATSKAEATKIIANFKQLKVAVMLYEAEHGPLPPGSSIRMSTPNSLDQYLDNPRIGPAYDVVKGIDGYSKTTYVIYASYNNIPPISANSDTWKQLEKMAEELNLEHGEESGGGYIRSSWTN